MSWLESFWKKWTTPEGRPPTLREIFGGPEPAGSSASPLDETLSNFTPRAQQVLVLARKEAGRMNHNFVGTEHLLLGLIVLGQGTAVAVLKKLGVDLENTRAEVEKQVGTGPGQKMIGNLPYTPRTRKVLYLASKEAKSLNHTYIGTEHILLGLLREGDGAAARILKQLNIDLEQTRQTILKELDPNFVAPGGSPSSASPAVPNLMTLCINHDSEHHVLLGHLDDYESFNPDVLKFVENYAGLTGQQIRADVIWQKAVAGRPIHFDQMSEADKAAFKEMLDIKFPPNVTIMAKALVARTDYSEA